MGAALAFGWSERSSSGGHPPARSSMPSGSRARPMAASCWARSALCDPCGLCLRDGLATIPASSAPGRAISAAIVIWGWHELSFLTGMVTGPRPHGLRRPAPAAGGGSPWPSRALAWHELALAGTALGLWLLSGTENQTGLIAFLILFGARISAKLNLSSRRSEHDGRPDAAGHWASAELFSCQAIEPTLSRFRCWV